MVAFLIPVCPGCPRIEALNTRRIITLSALFCRLFFRLLMCTTYLNVNAVVLN